jgi:hypothetical protein
VNARREEQRKADLAKLRDIEKQAVDGKKLSRLDRLKAAYHLTRAWKEANKAGMRKDDFEDAILNRLKRPHGSRQQFRLSNWTLRRGEDPTTQPHLRDKYDGSTTPQKALEPYLVGLAVAAEQCGEDASDWKLAMLRDLSIWSRVVTRNDVAPPDDRPEETLEILLKALCAALARRNRLSDTFAAIRSMNCRWEMFSERLVATDARCMQRIQSPISPVCEQLVYFGEMFPFPSIPLLRVPYAHGTRRLLLELRPSTRPDGLEVPNRASVVSAQQKAEVTFGKVEADGYLVWYREIRLCIVPDGHGDFVGALETRPHLKVRFSQGRAPAGEHEVIGVFDIENLGDGYTAADGSHVDPHIRLADGSIWNVTYNDLSENGSQPGTWTERAAKKGNPLFDNDPGLRSTGWIFDADPILEPGKLVGEPWYLSYTPATAPYLRHWLIGDWRLADEPAVCPWDRENFDWRDPQSRWNRDLPPVHELNFPDFSHATWIECCLHNGLIEDALQAKIDRLKEQTGRLQADWHVARESNTNKLLLRRKAKTESTETKE